MSIAERLEPDQLHASVRAFVDEVVLPGVAGWDRADELPDGVLARLVDLGLTGALGTVAETVDGVYTGDLVGEMLHGEGKAVAIRTLAEREGLDLDRCYAYSDSSNDLPMLSLVGNPCAVNPDSALRAHAKAKGWRIRDYRNGRRAALAGIKVAGAGAAVAGALSVGKRVRRYLG